MQGTSARIRYLSYILPVHTYLHQWSACRAHIWDCIGLPRIGVQLARLHHGPCIGLPWAILSCLMSWNSKPISVCHFILDLSWDCAPMCRAQLAYMSGVCIHAYKNTIRLTCVTYAVSLCFSENCWTHCSTNQPKIIAASHCVCKNWIIQ
jgi:hypothetical protein